jgi:hypothetical protein
LDILPLSCEYILSFMLFVIDNQTQFCSGLEVQAWILKVKINFICQFWIFLFFRMAPCVPVSGYLIDCPWPFKIIERIELALKANCFYILWIIHFVQLLNFLSIEWTVSLNCVLLSCVFCLLWYVMTSFMSIVFWTYEMVNVCMYVVSASNTRVGMCTLISCLL